MNVFDQFDPAPAPEGQSQAHASNIFDQFDEKPTRAQSWRSLPMAQRDTPAVGVGEPVPPSPASLAALGKSDEPQAEVPVAPKPSPAIDAGRRIGEAAAEGFGTEDQMLTPKAKEFLAKQGIAGDLALAVGKVADLAYRGTSGLFKGGQQAALELAKTLGVPDQLARDIAAMPEAFMNEVPGHIERGAAMPDMATPKRQEPIAPEAVGNRQEPVAPQGQTQVQPQAAPAPLPTPPPEPPRAPIPLAPEQTALQELQSIARGEPVKPTQPEPVKPPEPAAQVAPPVEAPPPVQQPAPLPLSESVAAPGPDLARFYHGGDDYTGGARWLTPDQQYAEGYARKSNGHVLYVDIPRNSPFLERTFEDAGTGQQAPFASFEAPEEIASKLKRLDPEVSQKPADAGPLATSEKPQPGLPLYSGPGALFDPAAWKFMAGPLAKPAAAVQAAASDVGRSIAGGIAPISSGTSRAQAFAADFANSLRRVMYRYGEIDRHIERSFSPVERETMGRALDAQSVFEQQVRQLPDTAAQTQARTAFDTAGTGLTALNAKQRATLDVLDRLSQQVWEQMRQRGLVDPNAQPLPYYFPRQIIQWTEAEGYQRATGQGGAGRGIDQRGANLTTAGPMRREHLTPEATEAAAQAKLGANASILRDIRSLPSRLAFSSRAIAGVDLMNAIDKVGKDAGVDLVVHGDIPGVHSPGEYFTMADHPSFRRWAGAGWQAVHVSKEFEGPLKAVLTQPSPGWYRAAQQLKGGVMSAIMWSPLIHLAVEVGRSLPVMPLRVLTLQVFRDGSMLRRDPSYMDQAIRDGLSPLGQGWHVDPAAIADQANVDGRNGFIRALAGARDAVANAAGQIGGQALHDIMQHPHQTLLWDQVFNLQVGLYNGMRQHWIEKGFDPDVAGTMAAHVANRYAGALPPENLSRSANMAANLLLFSRSFTLGNLGVMKDMLNGAPSQVRARIEQMAGPDVAKAAQSALRRKAIAAFTLDIGLFYMANGLLQAGLQQLRGEPAVDDWKDKAESAIAAAGHNPLSIFGVLPQHWNEPGKQDRVYAGTDSTGRGVYLRLPPGKVGEEFLGWFTKPGVLLMNKTSPLVRPLIELAVGSDSLGRQLLPPNPRTIGDYIDVAGAIAKHLGENLGPTSTIQGLSEMFQHHVMGKPSQGDPMISAMKVVGPMTGLAQISQGYPGGPQAGEIHAESERERYAAQHAMPDIRAKIKAGDTDGAVADMRRLGMAPGLIRYYLRQTLMPGTTPHQMQQFLRNAPPEVQDRMRRQAAAQ